MRLKSFTAPSMAAAMRQIRAEFGEDAVIVATRPANGRREICVTAAIDRADAISAELAAAPAPPDGATTETDGVAAEIDRALAYHRVPDDARARVRAAVNAQAPSTAEALAGALGECFAFAPLDPVPRRAPLALVGPPGMGKTVTIAKIAARAVLAKRPPCVITTDNFRAGGIDQLRALARLLDIDLETAASPRELERIVGANPGDGPLLIDTAGINPFSRASLIALSELLEGAGAEPVLTLAAGGNADDAAEIGEAFAAIGCARLVLTRLDATRRLGAALAAAASGGLAFSDVSLSPHVSRGLRPLDPAGLTRLLLCHPDAEPPLIRSCEAIQ